MPMRRSKQQWSKLIQSFEGSGLSHDQPAEPRIRVVAPPSVALPNPASSVGK